jgi:hypothetical protein
MDEDRIRAIVREELEAARGRPADGADLLEAMIASWGNQRGPFVIFDEACAGTTPKAE